MPGWLWMADGWLAGRAEGLEMAQMAGGLMEPEPELSGGGVY